MNLVAGCWRNVIQHTDAADQILADKVLELEKGDNAIVHANDRYLGTAN